MAVAVAAAAVPCEVLTFLHGAGAAVEVAGGGVLSVVASRVLKAVGSHLHSQSQWRYLHREQQHLLVGAYFVRGLVWGGSAAASAASFWYLCHQ